jgi:hypothetical protein
MTWTTPQLRAWCHINEFREEGYQNLPAMIALTKPLVLWSPSGRLMDEYHSSSPELFRLSSSDLLRFIRTGDVVVAGRREWITDSKSRNTHPWKKYSRWYDDFDEEIRQMAYEDEGRPLQYRRVAIMPPAIGNKWAKSTITKRNPVVKEVEKLIDQQKLPPGFSQRIKGKPRNEQIREILTDWRNHHEALEETKSDLTVIPWDEANPMHSESRLMEAPKERRSAEQNEEAERLIEAAVKLMGRIEAFPKVEYLEEFLKKGYRNELVDWLCEACDKKSGLRHQSLEWALRKFLEHSIEDGLMKQSPKDFLVPKSWLERGTFASGLVLTAVSVFLGAVDLSSYAGLTLTLSPTLRGFLELKNILPLASKRYSGPQWPFICTTGKTAHWNQYVTLLDKLRTNARN